ncbi:MAG: hypothetical protein HGA31_06560 [Candidatus Moranbacteria bacterium]|nr:hypothetical protein [Candidatus Moranbacteria bacterium]
MTSKYGFSTIEEDAKNAEKQAAHAQMIAPIIEDVLLDFNETRSLGGIVSSEYRESDGSRSWTYRLNIERVEKTFDLFNFHWISLKKDTRVSVVLAAGMDGTGTFSLICFGRYEAEKAAICEVLKREIGRIEACSGLVRFENY